MSQSESICIRPDLNLSDLNRHLRDQILSSDPPYSLERLLAPFKHSTGRVIRVVLNGLNVYIVESDIRHQVLQTTVSAFQRHRLRPLPAMSLQLPTLYDSPPLSYDNPPPSSPYRSSNQCTGKTCSICLETIYSNDLQCLPCAHIYHRVCLGRWLRQSAECPECRFKLT